MPAVPAESVNALTVGAAHDDGATYRDADARIEPMLTSDLPNVCGAAGGGVRRAVKPDVLLPGGRQLLTLEPRADGAPRRVSLSMTRRPPGVRVAAPGRQAGQLDATVYDTGTSPATGLGGYHAGHALDGLNRLRLRYGERMPGTEYDAVLVKAAIVHSARWGTADTFIARASEGVPAGRPGDIVTRMVGYGRAQPSSVLTCDDHRVTALGAAHLEEGQAHAYRFPLPACLASHTERRRLTITLAWFTPINPESTVSTVARRWPSGRRDCRTHSSIGTTWTTTPRAAAPFSTMSSPGDGRCRMHPTRPSNSSFPAVLTRANS